MPSLTWPTKTPPAPIPASLEPDSLVFPHGKGYPSGGPAETGYIYPGLQSPLPYRQNQLILGDNLAAISALLPQYAGKVNLIYADPPFLTNRRYPARIGRGEDSRKPGEWMLAEGYPDSWESSESYLNMLYPRLALMHRLLTPNGTLYLHLDWHASAFARLLLDEIFGPERLLNEIVWVYHGPSPIRSAFNRKHDTILVYTKSADYTFNVDAVRQPYDPSTVRTFAASPKAGFGKIPDLERGKVPEDWWYFPVVARLHNERTGYPTQKPEALLERILLASSNPGDLVADFFCGSGTALVVAARLGRRFLGSDISFRAVHTTRARLVEVNAAPFSLSNTVEGGVGGTLKNLPLPSGVRLTFTPPDLVTFNTSSLQSELDYWEIGVCPGGQVFHSLAQAGRPRKKGTIPQTLQLPFPPGDQVVLARFVTVAGEQFQASV